MSWDEELFAILDEVEAQAAAAFADERDLELVDRARAEYAEVTLTGRLMASVGAPIELEVRGVGRVSGTLSRVARSWCLVRGRDQEWVVAMAAVSSVTGASARAVPELAWSPLTALGLGSALRRIAQSQDRCVLHTLDGRRHEALLLRVGADFVEVATGQDGRHQQRGGPLIALGSVAAIQRRA